MSEINGTSAVQEIPFEEVNSAPVAAPVPEKQKKTKAIKKNVYQKLLAIQTQMKAPKNLYNSYGKYNYRNAEGILEALKPFLEEQECVVIMEDSIMMTEHTETITQTNEEGVTLTKTTPVRYIKATARFIDCESGEHLETSAFACECSHKNMTADQCTGTASSYARKYCLNALFLLDDTKDSDTDEMKNIENATKERAVQNKQNVQQIRPAPAAQRTQNNAPAQNQGRTWGQAQRPASNQNNRGNGWGR